MWNNPTDHVISWFCLQVLQYNAKAGTWSEMERKLKRARRYPAIVEANLRAVCFDIGKTKGGIHRNRKCNCLFSGLLPYRALCFMNTFLISIKKYIVVVAVESWQGHAYMQCHRSQPWHWQSQSN